jgi:uncharacterized protein
MLRNKQLQLRHVIVFLALLTGLVTLAQGKKDNTLLWKVEGKNIKTSFVYGTFHLLPKADFEIKDKVKNAFESSEQIVMELKMDDPGLQMQMMQYAMMQGDKTLDKIYTPEEYVLVDNALKSTSGMGLQLFNKMKPFIIMSMLMPSLLEGELASYEGAFVEMAGSLNKPILGLESVKDQLDVFDLIPYEKQAKDVLDIITDKETMMGIFRRMIDAYKAESVTGMYAIMEEYITDTDEFNHMLSNRNKKWIPKIADLAKDKPTFFAVGAGHLGGEDGVLNLLKKAGYKVTPVK